MASSNNDDAGVHAFILSQAQTSATAQAPAASSTSRSRNFQAGRSTEQATPTEVASNAPSSGLPSFLSALRGDTTTDGDRNARRDGNDRGGPSDAPGQTGTTIALRSETAGEQDGSPSAASEIAAFAPLPPHRPKSLTEIAALIDIPLPPARPNDIDPVAAATTAAATMAQANGSEPSNAGELVALDHPLPPARPQAFALAAPVVPASGERSSTQMPVSAASTAVFEEPVESALASTAGAAAAASSGPTLTGQVVRLDHPLPPARPVQFALALAPSANSADQGSTAPVASPGIPRRSPNRG